jgi:GNAT superfamily N-acetyltransferase
MTVVRLTVSHPQLAEAAELLDDCRQHYGANPASEAVESWMRDQMLADRMRVFAAGRGERLQAVCTVSVVPASLSLRTVWLVRDLYVDPDARRSGLARDLLAHVSDAARSDGAHRVSLQTEADNERALRLYVNADFHPADEVAVFDRML